MSATDDAWAGDYLDRQKISKFLEKYIDGSDYVKVVNINSPWGTGKTFFLSNWHLSALKSRSVVYFNAWENDFTGDPLISLIANIKDQLELFVPSTKIAKESVRGFVKSAGVAVLASAPIILKGGFKKLTGIDSEDVSEALAEGGIDAASGLAEKYVIGLIEANSDNLKSVSKFKESLSKLVASAQNGSDAPVYIFIDELDRCRPTYAIELLERVKHFFDVPGCKFIIATDTVQLAHAVKAVYGSGFSSLDYLKRFFDLTYSFTPPDLSQWVVANINFNCEMSVAYHKQAPAREYHDSGDYSKPISENVFRNDLSDDQFIFLSLADLFNVELRSLGRLKEIISAVIAQGDVRIFYVYIAYLIFLLHVDDELFNESVNPLTYNSAMIKIKEKYPARRIFYTPKASLSLHEIAHSYMTVAYCSRADLSARVRDGGFPDGAMGAAIDILNGKSYLLQYPEMAKLAVKIS